MAVNDDFTNMGTRARMPHQKYLGVPVVAAMSLNTVLAKGSLWSHVAVGNQELDE
jgi:hypothetical protein